MISYCEYMEVFAEQIERLHRAVQRTHEHYDVGYGYDYAVRLLIQEVLLKAEELARERDYALDPDVWLP